MKSNICFRFTGSTGFCQDDYKPERINYIWKYVGNY